MRALIILLALAAALLIGWQQFQKWVAANPEKVPWTELALSHPIGPYTAQKLGVLRQDPQKCLATLRTGNIPHTPLPPLAAGPCGYTNAVTLTLDGATALKFQPANPGLSCPVAAALALWDRDIVQPAALKHFGSAVAAIDHLGSYSCRTIAGSARQSEHAAANAIDIAGFRLENGTKITIAADWNNKKNQKFLREVRDGACQLFGTTLSPDYNQAHADHLHLDQAARSSSFCR